MTGQFGRSLAAVGFVALLLPGCLSFVNPVPKPLAVEQNLCKQLPVPSLQNVYIVFVNGVDPLCCANLAGVRDYLAKLGFVKSYFAQVYHEQCLLKELQEVHHEHPEVRFAFIGFDYGAMPVQNLAKQAAEHGLLVDLLVLLQPKGVAADAEIAPNVMRTVTIQMGEKVTYNPDLEPGGFVEIRVPCATRFGVPTEPHTLNRLAIELHRLASNVPCTDPISDSFPSITGEPAPTPRPVVVEKDETIDEWDFLKPVSRRQVRSANKTPAERMAP